MSKTKILLSIHPEFVDKIVKEEKTVEYRKVLPKGRIEKIVIYATYPIQKVVAEAEFKGYIISSPNVVWNMTKDVGGVSKEQFDSYYRNNRECIVFRLGKVTVYDNPKTLDELGLENAPQSFVYLEDDEKELN